MLMGEEWCNVPSNDASLKGVAAQTWLTAVRHVRAGNPKADRLNNAVVREAILAIKARNEVAMAKAGLNLEDWSEDRFKREEKNILAGVKFYEPEAPSKTKGELGSELPSVDDLTGEVGDDTEAQAGRKGRNGTSSASAITFEEE